jgi:hypothetical protein
MLSTHLTLDVFPSRLTVCLEFICHAEEKAASLACASQVCRANGLLIIRQERLETNFGLTSRVSRDYSN